ncbi:HEAT repeat domain-containing protein [Novosphingobium sp. ST904]|uniref:HEAT repeat domain-containing protein n=2 Tax=Novosphingobium sp. ST904 TaxID=1684385 RepID=UPI001E31B4E7|nr:HEAT repeat domain-containing protein [Novosphingobium sp. ST904]
MPFAQGSVSRRHGQVSEGCLFSRSIESRTYGHANVPGIIAASRWSWHVVMMIERYEPPSEFLKSVIAEQVPLADGPFAAANLERLIELTRDPDRANRDWAVLLLSQEGRGTSAVRDALFLAASDPDDCVRGEAILGLAGLDPITALPFLQAELRRESITIPALAAASICADPSLIPDLKVWAEPSDQPYADKLAAEALAACERAVR